VWLAKMYLTIPGQDIPGHSWLGCGCDTANMCLGRDVPGHSWPRCTWPFLAEMYSTIPGWDVVVMLPTCVLAEMYPAIPGRDVAGLLPY